jgi:acetyl esterase/lipase
MAPRGWIPQARPKHGNENPLADKEVSVRARIALLSALLLAAGLPVLPARAQGQTEGQCNYDPRFQTQGFTDQGIGLLSPLGLPPGRYALPESPEPRSLAVMMHGHGNDSCAWRKHLQQAAARGAVAFAVDYTGQDPATRYGWRVKEGARDAITVADYFLSRFPSIRTVVLFGVSMGGNSSGLAAAAQASRPDGSPLFDYWVDAEGVNDLIEEYLIARALAPLNPLAAQATAEIEQDLGGPIESRMQAYLNATNLARVNDIAASGLKGAVLVQAAVDDGLVPVTQNREMATALRAVGIPTSVFSVLTRGQGEDGTTLSSVVAGPVYGAAGLGPYESPLAGHGWEGSDTQAVIATAMQEVLRLLAGGTVYDAETPVS